MLDFPVMLKTKPSDGERFAIIAVVSFAFRITADFTRQPSQPAVSYGIVYLHVRMIFAGGVFAALILVNFTLALAVGFLTPDFFVLHTFSSTLMSSVAVFNVFLGAGLAFSKPSVCRLRMLVKLTY